MWDLSMQLIHAVEEGSCDGRMQQMLNMNKIGKGDVTHSKSINNTVYKAHWPVPCYSPI